MPDFIAYYRVSTDRQGGQRLGTGGAARSRCRSHRHQQSYRAIARELNRLNIKTGEEIVDAGHRGRQWYDITVKAALAWPQSNAA